MKGGGPLPLMAMIGVVQVNVTRASKTMEAKDERIGRKEGKEDACRLYFLKYSAPKSIKEDNWIQCRQSGKWDHESKKKRVGQKVSCTSDVRSSRPFNFYASTGINDLMYVARKIVMRRESDAT